MSGPSVSPMSDLDLLTCNERGKFINSGRVNHYACRLSYHLFVITNMSKSLTPDNLIELSRKNLHIYLLINKR